jgi:hypothetical protein
MFVPAQVGSNNHWSTSKVRLKILNHPTLYSLIYHIARSQIKVSYISIKIDPNGNIPPRQTIIAGSMNLKWNKRIKRSNSKTRSIGLLIAWYSRTNNLLPTQIMPTVKPWMAKVIRIQYTYTYITIDLVTRRSRVRSPAMPGKVFCLRAV